MRCPHTVSTWSEFISMQYISLNDICGTYIQLCLEQYDINISSVHSWFFQHVLPSNTCNDWGSPRLVMLCHWHRMAVPNPFYSADKSSRNCISAFRDSWPLEVNAYSVRFVQSTIRLPSEFGPINNGLINNSIKWGGGEAVVTRWVDA